MSASPAEAWAVDESLVRSLVQEQAPQYAALSVTWLARGCDNELFRLGEGENSFVARIPRHEDAAALLQNEERWVPRLPLLPLALPRIALAGRPRPGFPWPWLIYEYLEGEVLTTSPLASPTREARRLGTCLRALHVRAPGNAPVSALSDYTLDQRDASVERHLTALGSAVEPNALRGIWKRLRPKATTAAVSTWVHGDLHTSNVLVHDGSLRALIDLGEVSVGDRAPDLAIAWAAFAAPERAVFRNASGADDEAWARAHAWAFTFALAYMGSSEVGSAFYAMGQRMLAAASEAEH